jgi:D-alanyl-D-alanine carboxypeptidase/D-alanyl-D-alanine-endopeptidase (penicillin-binding protein 4)
MDKCIIKNKSLAGIIFLSAAVFLLGCSVDKRVSGAVEKKIRQSKILSRHYVGVALYSMANKKLVLDHNADKYFTPASNTKLFTFYAGLKMIPDRVPSLRYIEKGDSLIFWGTGDPSLLQTKLKGNAAYDFLKQSNKKLFFAAGRYTGNFYGGGWQWDDYNDYYQAEINELPLMDNLLNVSNKSGEAVVFPGLFKDSLRVDSSVRDTSYRIRRDFNGNVFRHPPLAIPPGYDEQLPYKVNTAITTALLADTLKKTVNSITMAMPAEAKTIYGLKTDSVLKEMMLPSDNFIAEQLLLVYSDRLGQELNAVKAIEHIKKNYLSALPDKPIWADGSGLSRYNLFTPRDIIKLLELIDIEVHDQQHLFSMFPAGGKTGTLKNAYPKTDQPFVFGKTGSLSNIYNQSGYILTKKGRKYIFSFMNNNFVDATADVRKAMAEIITYIHEKY